MENITNTNRDDAICGCGSEAVEQAQGTVATMAHKAQEAASALGNKAKDVAANVASSASHVASSVTERAGDVACQLKSRITEGMHGVLELGEGMTNFIRRNPIPVLIAGIGIGFLIARATARK